jgi:hypothetical protein
VGHGRSRRVPEDRPQHQRQTGGEETLRRAGWHTVRLEARVAAGQHAVGLSFTNDLYGPPEDRNLRILELRVR